MVMFMKEQFGIHMFDSFDVLVPVLAPPPKKKKSKTKQTFGAPSTTGPHFGPTAWSLILKLLLNIFLFFLS